MTNANKQANNSPAFQKTNGKRWLILVSIIPSGFFLLLSSLWYLWVRRKFLNQEVVALQTQELFLYSGNIHLPEVALTFDDGPCPTYTAQVLSVLQEYGVKATFFCTGRNVATHPDLVKQAYANGHIIGNHSWSHPPLALLPGFSLRSQLTRTSNIIQQIIGVPPTFFRPPYGIFNSQVLMQANRLRMKTVIWDTRATDWARPGIEVISNRVLRRAGNGSIILLHDGGGDRSQTVQALPTIIEGLQYRGFQFVTLQEMVNNLGFVGKNAGLRKDMVWQDIFASFFHVFTKYRGAHDSTAEH